MARYFLEFAYRGTAFHGWQKQPGEATVQGMLESALSTALRREVGTVGCGRTDTGVHASRFFAHFDADGDLPPDLLDQVQALAGADLGMMALHPVADDAHARFDAIRRSYAYRMHFHPDPFLRGLSHHHRLGRLDPAAMDEGTGLLPRFRDFTTFCKTHAGSSTTVCRVERAQWERSTDRFGRPRWTFRISADRFLRGMVRLIVGALIDLGRGKLDPATFHRTIAAGERFAHSTSAPAEGLYLEDVVYPCIPGAGAGAGTGPGPAPSDGRV